MLAGPNTGRFRPQMSRPRSNRAIADSWRGLYGSVPFSSTLRDASGRALRNGTIAADTADLSGFYQGGRRPGGPRIRSGEPSTLAIRNLTGSGAKPHPLNQV